MVQLIQLSIEDLQGYMREACREGAALALAAAAEQAKSEQVNTQEAMDFVGIKTPKAFRDYLAANGISAIETRGGRNYYLRSELTPHKRKRGYC